MMSNEKKKKSKDSQVNILEAVFSSADFAGNTAVAVVETIGELAKTVTDNTVVNFLKDKFKLGDEAAHEVSDHLSEDVVGQINNFDGGGFQEIFTAVSDTIRSIELPDIDLSNIEFADIDF